MADRMNTERPGLLDDWLDFFSVEPFGPVAANLMLARVCSSMAGRPEDEFLIGDCGG